MTEVAVAGGYVRAPARRRLRPDHDALVDVVPVLFGLVPFATVIGVQMSAGHDAAGGLAGSLLLYAGSAQVSLLSLSGQGAAIVSILVTVALVNARFAVYGAALASHFSGQPAWFRWLAPHFIVDQTFAMVSARDDLDQPARFRSYWLTLGTSIAIVWAAAMAAGVLLGPAIPSSSAVAFVPVAVFIALLAAQLRGAVNIAAAVAGGLVAVAAPFSAGANVLAGTAAGAVAGLLVRRMQQ